MVEAVGLKGVISVQRVAAPQPMAPVEPVATAVSSASSSPSDQVAAGGLARQLSVQAPVDLDRVAKIKKAIADGTFPLVPTTIADRMIALKLQWRPHDEA